MFNVHRGLFMDAAGAPAGGAGGASGSPAPGAAGGGTGTVTPPAAFDWKAGGFDDAEMPLITERQWKGPKDILTSYRNLEKLTGAPAEQIIRLPKDNDPAAWAEVYTKLGRPAKAEDYKLPVPEGDKGEFAKTAATWFHEVGLPAGAATKLAEKWNSHVAAQTKAQADATALRNSGDVTALKAEWGEKYDANSLLVDKAAIAFGLTGAHLQALKAALGPKDAMKFLHNLGSRVAVETNKFADGNRTPDNAFSGMTPALAIAKIAELKSDKNFIALWNSKDPKAKMEARQKLAALNQIAYPGNLEMPGS